MPILDLVLTLAALPVLAASLYLAVLTFFSGRRAAGKPVPPRMRFDIIVPAHNEEQDIAETVGSLLAVSYPRSLFRVLVVADNCSDATAERATAAGAAVLVRNNLEQRGKGYALAYAFDRVLADNVADAVIVVDADTLVSQNLLSAFAARFAAGAVVVQADYGVRNPRASWRTRLMTIALGAFHGVRSLGRERLGLSCGLRGNGMGFARAVLQAHPPRAFSIVEDLEYGIELGYAGVRVEYAHEVHVRGHIAVSEKDSRSQRRRWERGRQALVQMHARRLMAEAWRRRKPVLLDLGLDLIVPPLGQLVLAAGAGFMVSGALSWFGLAVAPWVWAAALGGILLHVARGWQVSGAGIRGLFDLLWAPVYVIWKLTLKMRDKGRVPQEWVRTKREVRL